MNAADRTRLTFEREAEYQREATLAHTESLAGLTHHMRAATAQMYLSSLAITPAARQRHHDLALAHRALVAQCLQDRHYEGADDPHLLLSPEQRAQQIQWLEDRYASELPAANDQTADGVSAHQFLSALQFELATLADTPEAYGKHVALACSHADVAGAHMNLIIPSTCVTPDIPEDQRPDDEHAARLQELEAEYAQESGLAGIETPEGLDHHINAAAAQSAMAQLATDEETRESHLAIAGRHWALVDEHREAMPAPQDLLASIERTMDSAFPPRED